MDTVYIETTIPSYLGAYPSKQVVMAHHQKLTQAWWKTERSRYRLYTSFLVRAEASRGDPGAVARRLPFLDDIPDLDVPAETDRLSQSLIKLLQIPLKAEADATHLALAILHRITYLLTWNCTHLANPVLQKELIDFCQYHRLHVPVICTPELLLSAP
ncbi:MAG: type II toxin-antitoxin system VapC family toxin [Verrucomicrobiaceae bacterium]|nr:type II toxin-antitoxin system VapC family toxin [Verrucomicrobiaceae bacterium]